MKQNSVLILGGGLAGLAAASALAPQKLQVTLVESRDRLGGRASSFRDSVTGQLIDNCQHVSMGCCTNFAHFCRTLGIDKYLVPQKCLYFMTPDGKISTFQGANFPAPFHLAYSFLKLHSLSLVEKMRIAYGLGNLLRTSPREDPPFLPWLKRNWQTQRTIDRFWGLVLVSALNETPDRMGLRYARKVFLDGFLRHRKGFEVQIPEVPLGQLYGQELLEWFATNEVEISLQQAVKKLHLSGKKIHRVELRSGEIISPDWIISALPFARLLDVLPEETVKEHKFFQHFHELETSPITSVHIWYDQPLFDWPHVVLVDCVGQWVFPRGQTETGEHYLQVVVSASRELRTLGQDAIQQRILEELQRLFPKAANAKVLRSRVVTEHAATFSALPGVDKWRPHQTSPVENLFVAGDWTHTGWPATMEGADRSGYMAAQALQRKTGKDVSFVQPDL